MQNQINHFSQSQNKGNTMINTQKTKQENRVLRSIGELFVDKSGGIDRAKNEKTVFLNNHVQYIEQIAFYNGRFVGEKGNLTTRGGEIVDKNNDGVVARNVRPRRQDGWSNDAGMWGNHHPLRLQRRWGEGVFRLQFALPRLDPPAGHHDRQGGVCLLQRAKGCFYLQIGRLARRTGVFQLRLASGDRDTGVDHRN